MVKLSPRNRFGGRGVAGINVLRQQRALLLHHAASHLAPPDGHRKSAFLAVENAVMYWVVGDSTPMNGSDGVSVTGTTSPNE
jgi:hypothetical protein